MDVVAKVRELDLPAGSYVVVGGGVLAALGLREAGDLDVLVSVTEFQRLRWRRWREAQGDHSLLLSGEGYEISICCNGWGLEELLDDAIVVNGVPLMNLQKLKTWKMEMDRQKDRRDIELIDQYLMANMVAV